jgi:hypothetical protein
MHKITSFCTLITFLITASCNQNKLLLPTDFAIKIEGGSRNIINTFDGKYTRSAVAPAMRDSTVKFDFTVQEKDSIYRALNRINYTALPERGSTKCEAYIDPHHTVKLTIRANGLTKCIIRDDGCITGDNQVSAVFKVIDLIDEIAAKHKEVQQIPRTTMMLDL